MKNQLKENEVEGVNTREMSVFIIWRERESNQLYLMNAERERYKENLFQKEMNAVN
jgi:hypothetical protein